ncbi:MAG: FAD-dependent oxidoreductase [Clostridia bacterium]|nr:FAD-dependent oxidoreductase [Clostridia bacterium]
MDFQYTRSLSLRYDVDVFVIGGGPAGCAAAIAAARQGARVLLAEREGCFGGLGTAGLVPGFMTFGDGERVLSAGIGEEILRRMWDIGGYPAERRQIINHELGIRVEALKRAYDTLLAEAGVQFLLDTQMTDVVVRGGRIQYCVMSGKGGMYAVQAKMYVDATGDGDVCAWAGVPFYMGDENGDVMPSTLCSLWSGINFKGRTIRDDSRVQEAYDDGVFSKLDLHLSGFWQSTDSVGGGNIGHVWGVKGTDERTLTQALVEGRKMFDEYQTYYRKYIPGFENVELVATANMMGIRESRRIRGEYTLCLDDFKKRAVFEDEIGRYAYPVDIHPSDNSPEAMARFKAMFEGLRYKKGESYGVPYRTIVPVGVDNLLMAGRCISVDRYMQSSMRVMPGCYITGQAAGVAAAQCAASGRAARDADVADIQRRLIALGQYLPNAKAE